MTTLNHLVSYLPPHQRADAKRLMSKYYHLEKISPDAEPLSPEEYHELRDRESQEPSLLVVLVQVLLPWIWPVFVFPPLIILFLELM